MRWFKAYGLAFAGFAMLDFCWLSWAGPHVYRPALGDLLASSFRPGPALAFYAIYLAGLVHFAVAPARGHAGAAAQGALYGACCYATYDLTNQATLAHWPLAITLADIGWGALASGLAAGAARRLLG